jgi:hypothetical protein
MGVVNLCNFYLIHFFKWWTEHVTKYKEDFFTSTKGYTKFNFLCNSWFISGTNYHYAQRGVQGRNKARPLFSPNQPLKAEKYV